MYAAAYDDLPSYLPTRKKLMQLYWVNLRFNNRKVVTFKMAIGMCRPSAVPAYGVGNAYKPLTSVNNCIAVPPPLSLPKYWSAGSWCQGFVLFLTKAMCARPKNMAESVRAASDAVSDVNLGKLSWILCPGVPTQSSLMLSSNTLNGPWLAPCSRIIACSTAACSSDFRIFVQKFGSATFTNCRRSLMCGGTSQSSRSTGIM